VQPAIGSRQGEGSCRTWWRAASVHAMKMLAAHWVVLAVALVTPLAAADTCEKEFASAEAFEAEVMDDDKVWAVVFHSAKKGELVCQFLHIAPVVGLTCTACRSGGSRRGCERAHERARWQGEARLL
jgi:hypothetical protein